ncbi:MAG: NAD-binding protein [bacterium]
MLILGGTAGYVFLEDYTVPEGFYMTIITVTTVGFGEVKPLSSTGRIFTSFLILLGFSSLAFVGHAVVEALLDNMLNTNSEKKKMKTKIAQLTSHYIICGFGRVGIASAEHFRKTGVDFVVIESDSERCQALHGKKFLHIDGDATNEEVLEEARIKFANGLLVILSSDPDNLYITLTARELNPTLHIIARAEGLASEKKLLRAGADSVISPFSTAGRQIASNMLTATGVGLPLEIPHNSMKAVPKWIDIQEGSSMVEQTIQTVSKEMGREIFGLRRGNQDFITPDFNQQLQIGDSLLVIDEGDDGENDLTKKPVQQHKVVIVDDNPIVLTLYSRLLRRAGFIPLTAENGREAFDLIMKEKPEAAVIDFMLPVLSGIDVCKRVRSVESFHNTKLILFTSDEQPETRERALRAGADEVVLKSPEASELIQTVIRVLHQDQKESPKRTSIPGAAHKQGEKNNSLDFNPSPVKVAEPIAKPTTETRNDTVDVIHIQDSELDSMVDDSDVIDREALLDIMDGDKEFLQEFIVSFLENTQTLLKQMHEAIEIKDGETLRTTAHTLKGSLLNFGASSACSYVCELEKMGKNGDLNNAEEVFNTLKAEIKRMKKSLKQFEMVELIDR